MKYKDYLLLYFYSNKDKKNKIKLSKITFWGSTLLMISMSNIKIQMENGHFLTIWDCFIEIEDSLRGYKFEGGDVRAWWEQNQWLRGGKKPYWIE